MGLFSGITNAVEKKFPSKQADRNYAANSMFEEEEYDVSTNFIPDNIDERIKSSDM